MTEPDRPDDDRDDRDENVRRLTGFAIEAAVGLLIALLLLWVALASATDVPFVYQGL